MDKRLTMRARTLRKNMTEAEKLLWSHLRAQQIDNAKFVRQFPIGNAVADFACRGAKLVIELDGGQHADCAADERRTAMINAYGYHVIRFWNNDVLNNIEGVIETIKSELRTIKGK